MTHLPPSPEELRIPDAGLRRREARRALVVDSDFAGVAGVERSGSEWRPGPKTLALIGCPGGAATWGRTRTASICGASCSGVGVDWLTQKRSSEVRAMPYGVANS
ncbi:hypothetical protein [Streptomyces sp. TP-A0356]|uniref:hypothetical protein n=1 Tax=Streptomyces sp. TP-A0356 TaxID=1359208 RepID=UPI0006E336A2|nr:hypothetical protein [Streptomyces sp. TP-A0356]